MENRTRLTKRRRFEQGFTVVELLVVISVIAILVSLLLPAINVARESARQTQCSSNLRQFGQAMANHASRRNGYLCTGAMDWKRDGCVTEIGWVADCVKSGVPVGEMLCPSNPSRITEAYVDLLEWNPGLGGGCVNVLGSTGKMLPNGSKATNPCRTIGEDKLPPNSELRRQLVESEIYEEHFNTNYTASWLLVRVGPHLGRGGRLVSKKVGCEADIFSTFSTRGPLRTSHLDTSSIPATFVPLLGCGASDRPLPGPVGDVGAGELTTKSFTRGPINKETMALPANSNPKRDGPDGWWQAWATDTLQDYRAFRPVHRRICNVLMADGSVRSLEDINDDGFLNNGFEPSPANGFADGEQEISPKEFASVYSLLDSSVR